MFSERVGLQGLREINNLWANVLSEFIKNHVVQKKLAITRGLRYTAGNLNENPSMRALAKILRARTSEHLSYFCEQFEQRPNYASTFKLDGIIRYPYKKHLQKRHRIFRRDREPSRIPARTHNVWETRAERLENMFLLFTNVSVRVHLSKTLWETS